MPKSNIYGPDLSEHEAEAARIAETGLKCMKSQSTSEEEKSDGPDASRNNLEKLK